MSMLSMSGARGPVFTARGYVPDELWTLRMRARAQIMHWAISGLAALAIALAATAAFSGLLRAPAAAPDSSEIAKNAWQEVRNPLKFYSLESVEFGREPRVYEARRHVIGGGRQDSLTFGAAVPGAEPSLRLSIYRFGKESVSDDRFFVEMARRAAQAGFAVTHSAQPGDLATRFGTFETADLTLATPVGEVACLGYRLEVATPGLRISGYACGAPGRPVDRRSLACALDRLDLVSAAEDRPLARFFVAAEQARGQGCGGAKGGSVQKASWLAGTPPLRDVGSGQNLAKR